MSGPSGIPDHAAPPRPPRTAALLVFAAAAAVFVPAIAFDFVSWDDGATLLLNPHLGSIAGLGKIWASDENEQYYPLTWTAYWIGHALWGLAPAGYHAANVLLHALNAVLVLALARRLGLSSWAGTVAALLFAVHPLQAMSVAWVAELKNLLSTLFSLLALLAWIRFRRDGGRGAYALALLAFALALAGKTVVILLPAVLGALDRAMFRVPLRRTALALLPTAALMALSAGLTVLFEKKFVAAELPIAHRPLVAAAGILFYLGKLAWPATLLPIYPRWEVSAASPAWWVPAAALVLAAGLLVRFRARIPAPAWVGLAVFVAPLVPVLGFVNFGNLALTFVSDHYVYLPCAGVFLVLALAADRWRTAASGRRRLATAAAALVVAALAVRTQFHLPVFRDAETFWSATAAGNPRCFTAHFGLGQEAWNRRDAAAAARHFQAAVAAMPGEWDAWLRLGEARLASGDPARAADAFRTVLKTRDLAPAWFGLGSALEARREFAGAEAAYRNGLDRHAGDAGGHRALAGLLLGLGRRDEAAAAFAEAVRIRPADRPARIGLATALRGQGRHAEAVAILRGTLELAPDDLPALNLLARILATSDRDEVRNGAEALARAERATLLTGGRDADVLDTLGAALAELGRFDDAAAAAGEAAAVAATAGAPRRAETFNSRADLYRRRQPLRESSSTF